MPQGLLRSGLWIAFLSVAAAVSCHAAVNEAVNWRLWSAEDGMVEAYITQLTRTPTGDIIIRNGDVPRFNVTDGVRLWTLPEPKGFGRIQADASGDLYTFDRSAILVFTGGRWNRSYMPELAAFNNFGLFENFGWFDYPGALNTKPRVGATLSGPGRMLLSFPEKLIEWSRSGGMRLIRQAHDAKIGEFVDVTPIRNGEGFFVSGAEGLATISKDLSQWTELPTPLGGATRLVFPFRMSDGSLLVTAGETAGPKRLLRYDGKRWDSLYSGGVKLRGWETGAGNIWAMEEGRLLSIEGHAAREVNLRPWLTGRMLDALPDGDSFWLGTMQGLARYSPPLWQTPAGAPEVDATVSSISEDTAGGMWFASGERILAWRDGSWQTYRIPGGVKPDPGKTGSLCALARAVIVLPQDSKYLLELDPRTGHFRSFSHPEGRVLKWIDRRDSSRIWVQTISPGEKTSRLETFDGVNFTIVPGGGAIPSSDLRAIITTKSGAIWAGGTSALLHIVNGKMHAFTLKDGPVELSAFSLAEAPSGLIYVGHRDAISTFDGSRFQVLRRGMDRVRRMAIAADGSLWAASGTGVHRFRNGEWVSNGVDEGLSANPAYTVVADSQRRIWAGTTLGFSLYHPESDGEAPVTALHEDQNLRQSAPGGEVRFAFSGTDRWKKTPEARLLFSWRIDGKRWSSFDKANFAAIRSLPSGAHVFEVRAMDRNGNIDPHPPRYEFSVLFPWYRESGFYFIAGILALIIAQLLRTGFRYHRDLLFQSRHDSLTGLPNRLQFEEALTAAVERPKTGAAVLFVDLDGFKGVNDALGHPAGDRVLTEVSRQLSARLGRGDLLARLGGDEFAILLTSVSGCDDVGRFADSVLEAIRRCSPSVSLPLAGSIGISLFPEHGTAACVLVRLADLAMYQSKSRSGDCRLFYDSTMKVDFRSAETAALIRNALKRDRLVLWYQPIVDAAQRVVHMECLVRIDDPVLGIVPPGNFIGVAEETGLIHAVGEWVLREAARTARHWLDRGYRVPVAVNISPLQLECPELADQILDALLECGLPPSSLVVEITESAIVKNRARAFGILNRLRSAGVRVSLDDFGTGYSSLSMLDGMPLDEIKLDRSFALSISGERTQEVICQTVALARKLSVSVVAEGIEETPQMSLATELGCDLFQGYLIAPPLEKQMATQFLLSQASASKVHLLATGEAVARA